MGAGTWRKVLGGAALALLALTCGGTAAAQSTGRVEGRVTDQTGRAVQGAAVTLVAGEANGRGGSAVSEQTGGFQIAPVAPGNYRLRVEKPGYRPSEQVLAVSPGDRVTIVVRLRGERRQSAARRTKAPAVGR